LRWSTGTAALVVLAATVAVAVASGRWWPAIPVALVAASARRGRWALAALLLGGVAAARSADLQAGLVPEATGPYTGWAVVAVEPQRAGAATRLVVEIGERRYEAFVRGRARAARARELRAGDIVALSGARRPLGDDRAGRVRWQHVAGELRLDWLGDVRSGGVLARSSNRVRTVIQRGAGALPSDQAALVRGLVIGDDRDQPPEMIERFRASGLSHLTAVSGQNVALCVAAAGPALRRARPFTRWVLTLWLIGWFVVLTRAEPSVLRAGVMAALGATAFALGRRRDPVRLLAVAVIALLLVDPLLAWSVGFWLSVGATGGVTVIGPWIAGRARRLGPLALPVGVTIGAQVGVAAPSLLVFGRLSLVGTVANLVAVPVAGFVMLVGLPACLVAGAVPAIGPVVMAPSGWAAAWVDAVATVGAAIEPEPPWSWLGWLAVLTLVLWLVRRPPPDAAGESGGASAGASARLGP
jgi:competence protein ComEC